MAEAEFRVTPTLSVPMSRFAEWYQGLRPLPGQDAWQFFEAGTACGLLNEQEAARLLARHRSLEAQEQGDAPEIPAEVHDWLISHGWQAPNA